jgi:hypothetical protein
MVGQVSAERYSIEAAAIRRLVAAFPIAR